MLKISKAEELYQKGVQEKNLYNFKEAIQLLEQSASLMNEDAMNELIQMYTSGEGKKDDARAHQLLDYLMKHKNEEAIIQAGRLFYFSIGVDDNKFTRGVGERLLMLGVEKNFPKSLLLYAKSLLFSETQKNDPTKILNLYLKASELGDDVAPFILSTIYKNGTFKQTIDEKKAREYLELSIQRGNKMAKHYLGISFKLNF